MKIIVPFAEGFEEIEGITIVDVLRRAGLDVTTAATGANPVAGSHRIPVVADQKIASLTASDYGCIILPGGMPGSDNLKNDDTVLSFIKLIDSAGGYIAALCAAPIVLAAAGVIAGKKVTCFPGFEQILSGATYTGKPVEVDGRIITGRGPGCALPFAFEIVKLLAGESSKKQLISDMQAYWM